MRSLLGPTAVLSLLMAACQADEGSLGEQAADVVSDTRTMREAQAAANDLLRNASDCDAVERLWADVNQKLDQAGRDVRTAPGQATLDALRKQVKSIGDACGMR